MYYVRLDSLVRQDDIETWYGPFENWINAETFAENVTPYGLEAAEIGSYDIKRFQIVYPADIRTK